MSVVKKFIDIYMISQMEQFLPALAKDVGAKDKLKTINQMKWAGFMNAYKNQAEEIINAGLIYAYDRIA